MLQYTNRLGDTYYVFQGKTKTGKPKYYASRKPSSGTPVEQLPEGFEIYEEPERGLVLVRKIRPSPILPEERQVILREARRAEIGFFLVDVQEDSLVVYTPGGGRYLPMLRFILIDEKQRLFRVQRWCFRGSIDGWMALHQIGPLSELARKYLSHLNRESFYDLM